MTKVTLALTEANIKSLCNACMILDSLDINGKTEEQISMTAKCKELINDIAAIACNEYQLQCDCDNIASHKTQKTHRLSGLCEEIEKTICDILYEHDTMAVRDRIKKHIDECIDKAFYKADDSEE